MNNSSGEPEEPEIAENLKMISINYKRRAIGLNCIFHSLYIYSLCLCLFDVSKTQNIQNAIGIIILSECCAYTLYTIYVLFLIKNKYLF